MRRKARIFVHFQTQWDYVLFKVTSNSAYNDVLRRPKENTAGIMKHDDYISTIENCPNDTLVIKNSKRAVHVASHYNYKPSLRQNPSTKLRNLGEMETKGSRDISRD